MVCISQVDFLSLFVAIIAVWVIIALLHSSLCGKKEKKRPVYYDSDWF